MVSRCHDNGDGGKFMVVFMGEGGGGGEVVEWLWQVSYGRVHGRGSLVWCYGCQD